MIRTLALIVATVSFATAQTDTARIETHPGFAMLSVTAVRPMDAIAARLQSQFGIELSVEDIASPVPARWSLELGFILKPDGLPDSVQDLLTAIITEANLRSPFGWRLDSVSGVFSFVATRTRNERVNPSPSHPCSTASSPSRRESGASTKAPRLWLPTSPVKPDST